MGATTTQGIRLWRSPDDITYTMIPDLTNVGSPAAEAPEIDASTFESAAEEIIFGLTQYGSINFTINFDGDNAVHQTLLGDSGVNTALYWNVELPERTGSLFTHFNFQAYVRGLGGDMGVNDKQEFTGELRLSGAVVETHNQAAQA